MATTTYAAHVTVHTHATDAHGVTWHGSKSVPLFYLDATVQGIVSTGHAARVAASVVNPLGTIPEADIYVSAYALD